MVHSPPLALLQEPSQALLGILFHPPPPFTGTAPSLLPFLPLLSCYSLFLPFHHIHSSRLGSITTKKKKEKENNHHLHSLPNTHIPVLLSLPATISYSSRSPLRASIFFPLLFLQHIRIVFWTPSNPRHTFWLFIWPVWPLSTWSYLSFGLPFPGALATLATWCSSLFVLPSVSSPSLSSLTCSAPSAFPWFPEWVHWKPQIKVFFKLNISKTKLIIYPKSTPAPVFPNSTNDIIHLTKAETWVYPTPPSPLPTHPIHDLWP